LPLLAAIATLWSAPAFAQGGSTSSISGTVVDRDGGAIPGATVVVKNEAGATFDTVTNTEGVFSVPALTAGTYIVTVSLTGFKTAVIGDVRIAPGQPASVKATLEVGQLEETITVTSSSELINTQTATVSATLNSDQLNQMPTPTRNALNAVTFLPGVNTATTNRNSTINGLPESFINITLDGVNNSDQFNKSTDGFFASVTPRQDAIEAVSVTTAAGGADIGGSGAVSISFATRSGTNRFSGSVYEYFRHEALNTNYWFNERNELDKNEVRLNQFGGRLGGPIVIPGLYDGRDKAFYFFHYEQLRFPNSFSRTRTVLHPRAVDGWFRYNVGGQLREVNVLDLARANGQIATIDATIQRLMGQIATATTSPLGALNPTTDPLLNSFVWQSPSRLFEHQPTVRLDYNLSNRHRLSGSAQMIDTYRYADYLNNTDARFPGAPNFRDYDSLRPLYSVTLRSTLSSNIVNELRGGTTRGGTSYFGKPGASSNGVQTFADQGGYAIDFDADLGLTNWHTTNAPSWRSGYTYSIDNTLSWQRGRHSMSFGGSALLTRSWESEQQMVPGINLRFSQTNDPAAGLFNNTNFPNATAGQLTDARALYALLTGRVTAITGDAALDAQNQYVPFGEIRRQGRMDTYSLFAQDSWRLTPTLTLNGGVRWDLQMPFVATSGVLSAATIADACGSSGLGGGGTFDRCNFYAPGATGGKVPEYVQLNEGTRGYDIDWNNFAPNVSVAWRPDVQGGFLRTLLGDPDQATLRGGYSVAYDRQGMNAFIGEYDTNPGGTVSLDRDEGSGLVGEGQWPVLLRETDRLFTRTPPASPTYPIQLQGNRADDMAVFAPDLKIASAHSWTVGFQRSLGTNSAIEIRYVGTRGRDQWSVLNYNDIPNFTMVENGFINEFRAAMANLQANNAAGGNRAGSFAYFGPGSGTSPLPIYLAYLTGNRNATDPAAYTGGSNTWTNSTLAQRLVAVNPQPYLSANDLDNNLTRRNNAARAGLAANFFLVNPDVDDVNVTDSGAFSDYHALQLDFRRRLSKGLQFNASYQYALEGGSRFLGMAFGREMYPSENVRHAIKTQWDWTIPVGRGERYGANMNALMNGLLGGWQFSGVGRIQARTIDFGNVRLVGMTVDELTSVYKHDIRIDPETGLETVFMLPQDIIDNTRRAFNVSTTSPTGYSALGVPEGRYFAPANSADCIQLRMGDCAPGHLMVRAPLFTRFDIGVTKKFPIRGSANLEVRFDLLNVFDNVNFNPFEVRTDTIANSLTDYADDSLGQVTAAYQDTSNTFDPGGRLGQLMIRFNW
jgi:hypothetical protein